MLVYLIIGFSYGFAAAVQPGPFQTFLISQSLKIGWRRTAPATFAPLLSDLPIAVLVLAVLSKIPLWAENMLHLVGGIFVIYLAYGAFQTWLHFKNIKTDTSHSIQQTIWKGMMVNLLNPAPYIGWSFVMGPLLLKGWREAPLNGFVLIIAFYGTMIITTIGIIILLSGARNLGPKIDRSLIGVSALALAGFGIYQFWLGVSAL
ncbi:MAG: LysE family transporter [Ignavibacteriales bacterium]|nr:LysE family transporter [Ignavibacteriales bacterium]